MPTITNKQIARILQETAVLVELTGGNSFRARALGSAARRIDQLEEPVEKRAAEGTLTQIHGIGGGLQDQIGEILENGTFGMRDELLSSLPEGLPELLRLKGLGAKKVRQIWQDLGVTTLDGLEAAAEGGQIASLKGFGKKTQDNILESIKQLRTYSARRRYAEVASYMETLLERLRAIGSIERAEPAGELRRKLETVGRADVILTGDRPDEVLELLQREGFANEGLPKSEEIIFEGLLPIGVPLRIYWTPPESFGYAWWRRTGAREHCDALIRARGVMAGKSSSAFADERDLYRAAEMSFIPPELRENRGELEAAAAQALPDLVDVDDLRGTLHNHTTYSDGAHSLREMAETAREMGLSYFGVCDHSRSLTIANGLSADRVMRQQEEIDSLNDEYSNDDGRAFHIFSGIESDILDDGALDYPDDVLETFDFIVASVHSGFNMTTEQATRRIVTAVEHPRTTILGHATGRLLLRREGYPIDHQRVIEACAANGVAIEVNANPRRLDMDWRYLRDATDRGVMISINPDAHSIGELRYVRWGVAVARKGWLTAAQCLNALPLEAFTEWLAGKRSGVLDRPSTNIRQ